jgi:hypothetical protein
MLFRLLDAHGHDNQTSKAFDVRSSCMQPCDHAEYSATTSIFSPYPLRFKLIMIARLNATITLSSLLSLATSRDSSTHGKSTHGKSDGVILIHDTHYNDQRNYLSKQTSFALTQSQSRPSMTIPSTMNYVWDRSFSSKTVIHPRSTSPHFSYKSSLFATTSRNEKPSSLTTINDRLCQQGLSSPPSSSSNNKAQGPQDCSQSASRIIKIFFVVRSTSRSQQPHLS